MTIKQMKALQNMVENGGNLYRAMIDAGYSPNTAKTPQKLTKSPRIQQYLQGHYNLRDNAVSSLLEVLQGDDIKGRLMVARFCLK